MKALEAAQKRHPYDREILAGLAHYSSLAGKREAALGFARQLQDLDPENRDYARLAATIANAPGK